VAEETTNQGHIDASSYASNPTGNAPDSTYQEYERGVNSYNLARAGEAALLASAININGATEELLIGKETLDTTTVGVVVSPDGYITAVRDGSVCAVLNRLTTDGVLAQFLSAGTERGTISVFGTTFELSASTGDMVLKTLGSEKARIDSTGNLLVGKTASALSVAGFEAESDGRTNITRDGATCAFVNRLTSDGTLVSLQQDGTEEGSISITGSTTSYNTTSDYRKKENVVPMTGATDRLKALKPSRFNFIGQTSTVDGFIAHEAQAVVPEAVQGEKDATENVEVIVTPALGNMLDEDGVIVASDVVNPGVAVQGQSWVETTPAVTETQTVPKYQQIDQSKLVPLLVATIQELEARITALEV